MGLEIALCLLQLFQFSFGLQWSVHVTITCFYKKLTIFRTRFFQFYYKLKMGSGVSTFLGVIWEKSFNFNDICSFLIDISSNYTKKNTTNLNIHSNLRSFMPIFDRVTLFWSFSISATKTLTRTLHFLHLKLFQMLLHVNQYIIKNHSNKGIVLFCKNK